MLTAQQAQSLTPGQHVIYNDGGPGHTNARAVVLEVGPTSMVVSFDDRADITRIWFNEADWMNHLTVEAAQ